VLANLDPEDLGVAQLLVQILDDLTQLAWDSVRDVLRV